jgi:phospholipase C
MRIRRLGLSRREFIRQTTLGAGGIALGTSALTARQGHRPMLPPPAQSNIEHVIVVMMENRSFDHLLGWLPGADGMQAGLSYLDRDGIAQMTHPLAPDFQGCGHPDPDHSYLGARVEYDDGHCDGWLQAGNNDAYAIGYYTRADLSFLAAAAPDWTACDRYFASTLAPTFPNRLYMHAAQTDRLDDSTALTTLPTIWDRLAEAGLTGRYYFSDIPFLALWGAKYLPISRPIDGFLADCAAGTLPNVSFVDPRFLGEEDGLSNDDHPHADLRAGEVFLNQIYNAVVNSPAWRQTVLVINYDEWGGFFEHVPPPTGPIPDADAQLGSDGRFGFRVPALIMSPFGSKKQVAHAPFDHTSILRMIEWRWNLPSLTVRDASATNLAEALDLGQPPAPRAPGYAVPGSFLPSPCVSGAASRAEASEWVGLASVARAFGWLP